MVGILFATAILSGLKLVCFVKESAKQVTTIGLMTNPISCEIFDGLAYGLRNMINDPAFLFVPYFA